MADGYVAEAEKVSLGHVPIRHSLYGKRSLSIQVLSTKFGQLACVH